MQHRYSSTPDRVSRSLSIILLFLFFPALKTSVAGQDKPGIEEQGLKPVYVTTRVFQMRAKRGSYQDPTDQVFKMRTAVLKDHDKWINTLEKTYPGFEIALLRTEPRRVFRTSKPTVVPLNNRQSNTPAIEISIYAAHSYGDGTTPGTSLIPEVSITSGNSQLGKPLLYSIQTLEIETGMTYFYSVTKLKLGPGEYARFVRPNVPAERFEGEDYFLIIAHSVDLDKTAQPIRFFDERQSLQLQNEATKKIQPEVPANLLEAGLSGFIRVSVEISPEGKVTSANIYYSSYPEINNQALAAARRWEFPASLFAQDRDPISGFITFSLAAKSTAPPPAPKTASSNSLQQ